LFTIGAVGVPLGFVQAEIVMACPVMSASGPWGTVTTAVALPGKTRRVSSHQAMILPQGYGTVVVEETVALAQKNPPMTLDEAVAEVRRDPLHSVHARIDGLEVELRVVSADERPQATEDVLGGAGPWVGETTEEILQVMQEFRRDDGREPPRL
jgi:hypothetical protein